MSSRGREVKPGASGDTGESAAATATDLRQLAMAKRARERKSLPQDGAPLDEPNRARMEGQMGGDLSGVRIHTSGESARAADDLQAKAFTVDKNIHFGAGEFKPGTKEGDHLLAHELSHTVQSQRAPISRYAQPGADAKEGAMPDAEGVSAPGDSEEKQADEKAGAVAEGLHEKKDGEKSGAGGEKKEEAGPQVEKGAKGIITGGGGLSIKVGDKAQELKDGMVVEVESAKPDELGVKVYSGMGGASAVIPRANFKPEPGVALGDDDKPRDDVYSDFGGTKLWNDGGPKVDDVNQGYIGDCYLVSAMGAVAAGNAGAIKKAFSPQTPDAKAYTVTLHKKNEKGDLEAASVTVDTMLPTQKATTEGAGADPKLSYAGLNKDKDAAVLWPALMEKAYSQIVGGYDKAGAGGFAGDAMEAITGEKAQNEGVPGDKDAVVERFKKLKADGAAVVCGTLGSKENKSDKVFTEKGGDYSATLTTHQGEPAEIVKNTLSITDAESKNQTKANDDGAGAIKGDNVDSGTVGYPSGKVDMKFKKDLAPDKPENLTADYQFRGLLDKALNVHAWHAYMFESVDGNNLIFKNPWGFAHPAPIPAERFAEFFTGITSVSVPKDDEPPPGAK